MSVMQAPSLGATAFPLYYQRNPSKRDYNYTISIPTAATGFTDPPWTAQVMRRVSYTGTFAYNVINTTEVEITGYAGSDTNLLIPESFNIDGVLYNVTSITADAFNNSNNIVTITIPRYVVNIGNGFLSANTSITTINVDTNNAFYSATNGVLYDKNNQYLIKYPNKKTGTSYSILNTTKVISTGAFSGSSVIRTITIPTSVIAISSNSFDNCTSLTTINFSSTTPPILLGAGIFPLNVGLFLNVPTSAQNTYRNSLYYYVYRSYIS